MPEWTAKRTHHAQKILEAASQCSGLRVPSPPQQAQHAYYKAYAFVRPEALKTDWSRDRIIHEINQLGVPCYQGSCSEVYLEKAFDHAPGRPPERLDVAKQLGETSLMFLVHPTLEETHIMQTTEAIPQIMAQAQR